MGCMWNCFKKVFVGVAGLAKLGCSIAIICIVAIHLTDIITLWNEDADWLKAKCLMDGDVYGNNLCNYAYAVCGISMLTSLVLSLFLCITCDGCGCGAWIELILGAALTAWWVIAGIVFTTEGTDGNDKNVPQQDWRNAVIVLTWVCALLSFLISITYLVDAIKCLRDCCSCCTHDDHDSGRKANVV